MDDDSVLGAVRSGEWTTLSPGRLGLAAAVAALLDVTTTYHALTSDQYHEVNHTLATLAEIHVSVAIFSHAAFALLLVGLCVLSLGWLSVSVGWFVVLAMGAVGTNNLVGFWTGVWLLESLPIESWVLTHYVLPPAAFAVGVVLASRRYRALPPREVGVVATALVVVTSLPPMLV